MFLLTALTILLLGGALLYIIYKIIHCTLSLGMILLAIIPALLAAGAGSLIFGPLLGILLGIAAFILLSTFLLHISRVLAIVVLVIIAISLVSGMMN